MRNSFAPRRAFLRSIAMMAAGLGSASCRPGSAPAPKDLEVDSGAQLLTESSPADDGFWFPPEWSEHEMTIMAMPPATNWRREGFSQADLFKQWAAVANAISAFEPVLMIVRREDRAAASTYLSTKIELIELPLDDGWSRDAGPMVLVNGKGERRVAGFAFNGWGRKFDHYADDKALKFRIGRHLGFPIYPSELVLEGGAVCMDGEGTVITTDECLLHRNRNPAWTKQDVEEELNAMLGTTRVLWLPRGLTPDPITDGHVDGIAAFAKAGVVLLHKSDDLDDLNHGICAEAREILATATDARGRRLTIVDLPLTDSVSHMNFYIGNGFVIVPIEGDARADDEPMAILSEVFDDREVIGVSGLVLSKGGGGIHCITQQVPRATNG